MATAQIIRSGASIAIKAPFNSSLVAEIKDIPGRKWDALEKVWTVPTSQEQAVHEIVRKFFQIEGEESSIEYQTVHIIVRAKSSYKRSYLGGVTVDGHDIINLMYGNVRQDEAFEVIEEHGGFVRGDSHHAFEVEYELVLKVRKGAIFQTTGHADHWGSFEFVRKAA